MFDQFYYTHCTAKTSRHGRAEFGLRAASQPNSEIAPQLNSQLESLAGYFLPLDLEQSGKSGKLKPENAPIRLARLRTDDGTTIAIHSVYQPADTLGRPNSYFSHVVVPTTNGESPSVADMISSWGMSSTWGANSGWVWRDAASGLAGDSTDIPKWSFANREQGRPFSLDRLKDLLLGEPCNIAIGTTTLEVVPKRLLGPEHAKKRRLLVEVMLTAFLRKRRICLVAEPGLSALLVLALTQLLPPDLTESLTFSTYEAHHYTFQTLRRRKLDVLSTFWKPESGRSIRQEELSEDEVALNTFTCEPSCDMTLPHELKSYVGHVIDMVQDGEFDALSALWTKWTQMCGGEKIDRQRMLECWRVDQRLLTLKTGYLPIAEIQEYIEEPSWRHLLLAFSRGREQAVTLALRDLESRPKWWPSGPKDGKNLAYFKPHIEDFRRLVLEHIVTELSVTENPQEHLKVAMFCVKKLLPGLTDAQFTIGHALKRIFARLQGDHTTAELIEKLPASTRYYVLGLLYQYYQSSRDLPEQYAGWFIPADAHELSKLYEKLPDQWKLSAVVWGLLAHDRCDEFVADLCIRDHHLLRELTARLISSTENDEERQTQLLTRVFATAVSSDDERVQMCLALLDLQSVHDEPLNEVFRHLFGMLVSNGQNPTVPWHLFFLEDRRPLTRLLEALDDNRSLVEAFWLNCFGTLDASSLFDGNERHAVLSTMLERDAAGLLRWPVDNPSVTQLWQHWKRVYAGLRNPPPPGDNDWYALHWSLRCLRLKKARVRILAALTAKTTTVDRDVLASAREIVDCARVLLSPSRDVIAQADLLNDASKALDNDLRSSFLVNSLHMVCSGNPDAYAEVLKTIESELPNDIVTSLVQSRDRFKPTRHPVPPKLRRWPSDSGQWLQRISKPGLAICAGVLLIGGLIVIVMIGSLKSSNSELESSISEIESRLGTEQSDRKKELASTKARWEKEKERLKEQQRIAVAKTQQAHEIALTEKDKLLAKQKGVVKRLEDEKGTLNKQVAALQIVVLKAANLPLMIFPFKFPTLPESGVTGKPDDSTADQQPTDPKKDASRQEPEDSQNKLNGASGQPLPNPDEPVGKGSTR